MTEFSGFDANNDEHYNVADTIVRLLKRYNHISGAADNSHNIASIDSYRAQLGRFKAVKAQKGVTVFTLTEAEIKHIMQ